METTITDELEVRLILNLFDLHSEIDEFFKFILFGLEYDSFKSCIVFNLNQIEYKSIFTYLDIELTTYTDIFDDFKKWKLQR